MNNMSSFEEYLEKLRAVKDLKTSIQQQLKNLNEQEEYLEQIIISKMQQEGITSVKASIGTATIKTEQYPQVEDWDKVLSFVIEQRAFELLKKAINSAVWRETFLQLGEVLPGVQAFEKQTLLFRRR